MTKAARAAAADPLSFRDWVANKQKNAGVRRKGERTRDRIRLCTAELLNEVGYRELKLTDICKRAKISPPVLYLYFESKEALVNEILKEFLQEFMNRATSTSARSPFQAMYDANLQWIKSARANAGLMRCLLQFSEEQREFAQLFARESNSWHLRVTQSVLHRFPSAAPEEHTILFIVHALGGMVDEITRRLFAEKEPTLVDLSARVASTDEDLSALLTTVWHRALYACDPPASEARAVAPLLAKASRKASSTNSKPRRKASS